MDIEMIDLTSSASSSPAPIPMISQRIVTVDFYTCPPNYLYDHVKNEFSGSKMNWVPIIRIYGATTTGQKACAHIHGAFPYLYIKADKNETSDDGLFAFAVALDESICRALPRQQSQQQFYKGKQNCQHIVKINRVKGRSYYGYYEDELLFYKIYFYSPFALTKAAEILIGAGVNGKKYQPFESHIPFIQQFSIDYNLFGMNLIHYGKLLFRCNESQKDFAPRKSSLDSFQPRQRWVYSQMSQNLFQPETVKRMSRCKLEFDVLADDILNRQEKRARNSNPGITAIWQDELERRRQNSVPNWSEITVPSSQDRIHTGELFEDESLHFAKLKEKMSEYKFDKSVRVKEENLSFADLLPSSQPDSFGPQGVNQIDLDMSILEESQSQSSQCIDNDYVINLFEEMANEVKNSENHEDKLGTFADDSILGSQEYRDIFEAIDESEMVASGQKQKDPILREFEEEFWSESFVSPTYDEFEILKNDSTNINITDNSNVLDDDDVVVEAIIPSNAGASRTNPKNESKEVGNETKRFKNDEILQEHNCKIIFQLETNDNRLDEAAIVEALCSANANSTDSKYDITNTSSVGSNLDVDVTSYTKVTNGKNQAQLLFPKLLQRFPKEFITLMSRPLHTAVDSNESINEPSSQHSVSTVSTITSQSSTDDSNGRSMFKSSSNVISLKNRKQTTNLPKKTLSRLDRIKHAVLSKQQQQQGSSKVVSSKVDFGVQFGHVKVTKDFSVQSYPDQKDFGYQETPVTRDIEMQTDLINEKGKKTVPKMTFWCTTGTQTENMITTAAVKSCRCRCTCSSASSTSSTSSTIVPPQIPKKFRPGLIGLESSPKRHGQKSGSRDNSPSSIHSSSDSKSKTKDTTPTRQNGLPNLSSISPAQGFMEQSQLLKRTLDYSNLNVRRPNLNLKDSRLLELLSPHSGAQTVEQQGTRVPAYGGSASAPTSSPLVGQLLRERFRGSTSKRDKELETALGTLEFMQIHYDRNPDLSIESIYEYHSPETDDSILKRIAAAHEGMTLFEWQKKRAEDRTKAKNERRKELENQVEIEAANECPIFAIQFEPMKQAPEEVEVNEIEPKLKSQTMRDPLVESSPMCDDANVVYYHVNLSDDEIEDAPAEVCKFHGGNLSDNDSDDNDANSNSQSSQTIVTPTSVPSRDYVLESKNLARGYKTPEVVSQTSSDYTPKSILKSGRRKRLSNPLLNKRKIKWGTDSTTTEDSKRCKINEDEDIISSQSPISSIDKVSNEELQPLQKSQSKTLPTDKSPSDSSGKSHWTLYNPDMSELDAPSPVNPYNAKLNVSNLQHVKAVHYHQYMTTMCVEVFCSKRKGFCPNPQFDQINAIFYSIYVDEPDNKGYNLGMLAIDVDQCLDEKQTVFSPKFDHIIAAYFPDEVSMFNAFIKLVQDQDPDIFVGYEIHYVSLGYLIERGTKLGLSMIDALSRILPRPTTNNKPKDEDAIEWNELIRGRIVLNLWRHLRHEMTVQSYTFASAMFNIMHVKVPRIKSGALIRFWNRKIDRFKTVDYMCTQVCGVMDIIDKLDLINRTSELARLFGIQFFEVFSRGSQFRVESMMLRLTKSDNFLAASPTVSQRARMRAPEELPLIMEPYSKYYKDPVAVLDFQSLYPSIMIAYNYDFSTCLGRVEHLGKEGSYAFGCLDMEIPPYDLNNLMKDIHISPCGVAFVKPSIRRGILPEMLQQILSTRLMVKRAMKANGNESPTLQKVLDSRQLGLKLIANVTYGYTSANFSGRMPCVEIADSVVSKGRETLVRAIKLVETNESRWGAKVIYGDTDSMFLLFPGCSREVAFDLAQDIADEVTRMNPKPVKLKLEKVYQPCILQTKKRYVGFSYESPQQAVPKYDAKGIETVRRDGCPAVAKILERSLRILFKYDDIARLKQYIQVQFQKIFLGKISLSDYTFAREYRGRTGYKPGAVVPSLRIAQRLAAKDLRAEPQPSERVPYVIVYGGPGQTLISQVRTPMEFANNPNLRIDAVYYIERAVIPALERCFKLASINVKQWYTELPRKYMRVLHHESRPSRKGTLDWFVISKNCLSCDGKTDNIVCVNCLNDNGCLLKLEKISDNMTSKINATLETCEACEAGICISLDCQTWQRTIRLRREHDSTMASLRTALQFFRTRLGHDLKVPVTF